MTTQASPGQAGPHGPAPAGNWPGVQFLKNLKIGSKLTIGFGLLVALTFLSAGVSYLFSSQATDKINLTDRARVPTALAAARAQANLLRMLGDVHAYLALGDQEYRDSYHQSEQAFQANLKELDGLSPYLDSENQRRLGQLKAAYEKWSGLPDPLFELRDDQLEREPAYRILATDGLKLAGKVLIDTNSMIEEQGQREPTAENLAQLADMAKFQGNFAAMLSALRSYVATRNTIFKQYEYGANLTANQTTWERLLSRRSTLTSSQQKLLDNIQTNRDAFLTLPDQIFAVLESDHWREDLYLFRTQAVPLSDEMHQLLSDMTSDQQAQLSSELASGGQDLIRANQLILSGGIVALLIGLALAFITRATIAGPIRRLTSVAEQIRGGDLEAQARVESKDEIGVLAETFNAMTRQLRQTLLQVRKEKRRADDLLEVVIPIGVELSSEKDFNRLLENILLEAKSFCHADAGILYLKEEERLKFVIVRNDTLDLSMGGTVDKDITFSRLPARLPVYDDEGGRRSIAAHAASIGASVNIPDAYQPDVFDTYGPGVFDEKTSYRSVSYLTIPLKNSLNQVLGVLQLINAQESEGGQAVPFDPNLQQMMESYSSLAVAALEAYIREQSLRQQIQQLRIEIDEVKRQKQVSEIVDTDFFQDLRAKARAMRDRKSSS
jgi:CHASE3 domain sensor protein